MNNTDALIKYIEIAEKHINEASGVMKDLFRAKHLAELAHHAMCLARNADVSAGVHAWGSPERAAADAAVDGTRDALDAAVAAINMYQINGC